MHGIFRDFIGYSCSNITEDWCGLSLLVRIQTPSEEYGSSIWFSFTVMNVTFSNAVCSNHGGTAVLMYGSYTLVHNITAYGLGCGGIVVEGGDLVCSGLEMN